MAPDLELAQDSSGERHGASGEPATRQPQRDHPAEEEGEGTYRSG